MTIPAWGTAPDVPETTLFTVVGFYAQNGQRVAEHVEAANARAAEDIVMRDLGSQTTDDGGDCGLRICGVFAIVDGRIQSVDAYATYPDPDEQEQ